MYCNEHSFSEHTNYRDTIWSLSLHLSQNIHIQPTSSIIARHRRLLFLLLTWDYISQKTFRSLAPSHPHLTASPSPFPCM